MMVMVMVFLSKVRKEYNNNKRIVNTMWEFVIISITIVHCAIGTQHDFGEGEGDIEYDGQTSQC